MKIIKATTINLNIGWPCKYMKWALWKSYHPLIMRWLQDPLLDFEQYATIKALSMYFVLQKKENNYFVLIFFQKKKKSYKEHSQNCIWNCILPKKKKKMIIIKNQKYNVKLMPMNLSKMKQKKILHYPFLELRNK